MGDVAQLPGAADRGSAILPGLHRPRPRPARRSANLGGSAGGPGGRQGSAGICRVTKATREAQADCFLIIKYAEMRLVEEVRAAQERGELARHGGVRKSAINPRAPGLDSAASESGIGSRGLGTDPATLDEIGIPRTSASPNGAKSMMLAARPPSRKPFRRPWTKAARRPTPTSSGRSREATTAPNSPAKTSGTRRPSTSRRRGRA